MESPDALADSMNKVAAEEDEWRDEARCLCWGPRARVDALISRTIWIVFGIGMLIFSICVWIDADGRIPMDVLVATAVCILASVAWSLVLRRTRVMKAEAQVAPQVREFLRGHHHEFTCLIGEEDELADELTRLSSADQQ